MFKSLKYKFFKGFFENKLFYQTHEGGEKIEMNKMIVSGSGHAYSRVPIMWEETHIKKEWEFLPKCIQKILLSILK